MAQRARGGRLLAAAAAVMLAAACASLPETGEAQAEATRAAAEGATPAVAPEPAPAPAPPAGSAAGSAAESPAKDERQKLPEPQAEEPKPAGLQPEPEDESGSAGQPATLPVPKPPAQARKPGKSAEAGPAAGSAAGARPSASKPKAPAAGGGPAAQAPAAPAPAAKPPAAPPATPQPELPAPREVLARKGDTVVIDLEGRGWLLLPGERRGLSFLGSESGPLRTSFSFKAQELGDYELAFQLQDNTRGAATGRTVRLKVLTEERLRELLAAQAAMQGAAQAGAPEAGPAAGPAPESADPARLAKAEQLFAGGFYDLALPEYLALYREADPLLNDRLAAIYLRSGEAAAAAKFFDRNLQAGPPYGARAVLGLVRAGLAMRAADLVLQHLPALLELPPADTERELLGVSALAAARGSHALALELLSEYQRRYPRGAGLDEAYFQLAMLYEMESPLRNLRLAREYYRRVYDLFPESEHAEEARTRIQYLDRHFFHVQ